MASKNKKIFGEKRQIAKRILKFSLENLSRVVAIMARMAIIRKKLWPKWFKIMMSGKQNVQMRLADFKVKPGDILLLEEWNPDEKEYTGKLLRKRVKRVIKLNPLDFYSPKALKKYGCYLIEF